MNNKLNCDSLKKYPGLEPTLCVINWMMCGEIMTHFIFGVLFVVYTILYLLKPLKRKGKYMKPVGNYDNEYLFHS